MRHVWFLILPRTLLCNTTYSCPLIHTDTDIRHHSSTSSMEVYNSHQHKTCLTHIILGPVFHSRAPVHQILPLLLWYKEELVTQLVNMYFCELIFHFFIKEAVPSLSCLFCLVATCLYGLQSADDDDSIIFLFFICLLPTFFCR